MPQHTSTAAARLRERIRRGRRAHDVYHPRNYRDLWFYMGYLQAVRQMETAANEDPMPEDEIRRVAEQALKTWVDTGRFPSHPESDDKTAKAATTLA